MTRPLGLLCSSLVINGAEGVGGVAGSVVPHLHKQRGFVVSGASGNPEEDFGDADAPKVERLFAEVDEDDGRFHEAAGIEFGPGFGEVVIIAGRGEVGVLLVGAGIEASARIVEEADVVKFNEVAVERHFVGVDGVIRIVGGIFVGVNGREGEGAAISGDVAGSDAPVVLEVFEAFLDLIARLIVFGNVDQVEFFPTGAIDDGLIFCVGVECGLEFVVGRIFFLVSEVGPFQQSIGKLVGFAADIFGIAGFAFKGFLLCHVVGRGSANAEGLDPGSGFGDREYDGEYCADDQ